MRSRMSEDIENVEYDYVCVSGEAVVAISNAIKLHKVVVNQATSGEMITFYDGETSGGVAIGRPYATDERPFEFTYDVGLNSGFVVVTSGATWNLTVLTK